MDAAEWITTRSLGESWVEIARRILDRGRTCTYDSRPIRELMLATLQIQQPDPDDAFIARHADRQRLAWMHANFTDHARVPALGDADSYATRLFDYDRSGLDQVQWAVARLRADPLCRSATITTFQPHTDTTYIPCVSMLDFWLDEGRLQLTVYAHSIDFGAKGYGNLVELASVQHAVAGQLGAAAGTLTMIVKSAHIYDSELDYMRGVVASV
ncbi:MAG: Thymidylate synthase [Pseudonocardiales bacterium]|nr:Thymidylate synthase [Pseudonocardiales bacterium]